MTIRTTLSAFNERVDSLLLGISAEVLPARDRDLAIRESVRTRIRPIFMSASTTIFGMLPLVISKGWGSELYRGIGSVLLGGLAVSTIFTLFVIPALLAFFIGFEKKRQGMAGDSKG